LRKLESKCPSNNISNNNIKRVDNNNHRPSSTKSEVLLINLQISKNNNKYKLTLQEEFKARVWINMEGKQLATNHLKPKMLDQLDKEFLLHQILLWFIILGINTSRIKYHLDHLDLE
jgi:hypothetical protein